MNLTKIFEGYLSKRIIFQQFGFFSASASDSNQQTNLRKESVDITRYGTKFASDLGLDFRTQIQKTTSDELISIKY
jgi:hypothetical protein